MTYPALFINLFRMAKPIYYKAGTKTNKLVECSILDKNDHILWDTKLTACFSVITYQKLPKGATKIIFPRSKETIPYDFDFIQRWINELNEFGFPCAVEDNKSSVNFIFNVADFKYKIILSSTLQLVRCLTETGICYIPENYFRLVKLYPKQDKFLLLQDAHRTVKDFYGDAAYLNTNHIVTGCCEGENISKETFLARVANNGVSATGHTDTGIEEIWN